MKFQAISKCRRPVREQRAIHALLEMWSGLPARQQAEARALIGDIARTAPEGRALFDLLTRGRSPRWINEHTGVTLGRLYDMRREFYDRWSL